MVAVPDRQLPGIRDAVALDAEQVLIRPLRMEHRQVDLEPRTADMAFHAMALAFQKAGDGLNQAVMARLDRRDRRRGGRAAELQALLRIVQEELQMRGADGAGAVQVNLIALDG